MENIELNTRVTVWGTLKNGIKSTFSGNLDKIIATPKGTIAIVNRLPVYDVTYMEVTPSKFEHQWK